LESTYEKILKSAYRNFAGKGYEQTSLNLIAKEIGISKPALYYYFSSKEILFEKLYENITNEIKKAYSGNYNNLTVKEFYLALIEIGLSGIRGQNDDEYLGPVLKQFALLSLRYKKLKKYTETIYTLIEKRFNNLMIRAYKLDLIQESEIIHFTKLFYMVDMSISDQLIQDKTYDYESMWILFTGKMMKDNFSQS
jgi:AcrR family transcriptional regulator